MAHIDHSFPIERDPAAAQVLFLNQIGPELAKDGSFHLIREHPGELVFADGLDRDAMLDEEVEAAREGAALGDEEGLGEQGRAASTFFSAGLPAGPAPLVSAGAGETLFADHLHVDFSNGSDGRTQIRIHGHVRRRLRDALARLGSPGHWPAIADEPHD